MDVGDILHLQYRKLLTMKETLKICNHHNWKLEKEDMVVKLAEAMCMFLIEFDNMNLPELDGDDKKFLELFIEALKEDSLQSVIISYPARMRLVKLSDTRRVSEEWNKIIALAFTDYYNEREPIFGVGKESIEKLFKDVKNV